MHKLWKPIEGRFKDYIAMPKSNRYQSLHTTVMGCERQDASRSRSAPTRCTAPPRTGIAAHWLYKNGAGRGTTIKAERADPDQQAEGAGTPARSASPEFLDEIKRELLRDSIYVFTPKGDVIELPTGSTAVDFAYHIHTEIGNHCLAAKADGAIIPLKEPLPTPRSSRSSPRRTRARTWTGCASVQDPPRPRPRSATGWR